MRWRRMGAAVLALVTAPVVASCAGGVATNATGWTGDDGSAADVAAPQDAAVETADDALAAADTMAGNDSGGDASGSDAKATDATADADADAGAADGPVDTGSGGVCSTGASTCVGLQRENCVGGQWQPVGSPCPYACSGGACTGSCAPGSTESCPICGTSGTATCTGGAAWGACAPPSGVCAFVDQSCSAACDTTASCWPHVDRSYNASTGEHFYTTSDSEAACCGFTVEFEPYYYLYSAQQTGLVPFYRCALPNGLHLYTTDASCEGVSSATNEGSMGFIATSAVCGSVPLYRLYDGSNSDHLYTTSSAEVTSAESGGYTSEGVAGYVWTKPEG